MSSPIPITQVSLKHTGIGIPQRRMKTRALEATSLNYNALFGYLESWKRRFYINIQTSDGLVVRSRLTNTEDNSISYTSRAFVP